MLQHVSMDLISDKSILIMLRQCSSYSFIKNQPKSMLATVGRFPSARFFFFTHPLRRFWL